MAGSGSTTRHTLTSLDSGINSAHGPDMSMYWSTKSPPASCQFTEDTSTTPSPPNRWVRPRPTVSIERPNQPGYVIPGPSTFTRGSTTSRTGQMRTDSPGRASSSRAAATSPSSRTAASAASRSISSTPSLHRVRAPNRASRTGNVPSSRRMARLLVTGRIEQRRSRHGGGQRSERGANDLEPVLAILGGAERGVAAHVLDPTAAHHPVGAGGQREVVDGRDQRDRDADPLDLLGDRCAATIAGPSGRDQQAPADLALKQLGRDALAEPPRRRDGCTHAGQRVRVAVHGADQAFLLQLAHVAERQHVVRVLVDEVREVADVIGLPLA